MADHEQLWGELSALLRGLRSLHGHVLARADVRCEVAGAAVLGQLELLGPVRLTELAQALGLDPSSVSRQVSALERAGWVTRADDPTDRRAQRLQLTAAGSEVVAAITRERATVLERLTPDWSGHDLEELTGLLARLNADIATHREQLDVRLETA
jgi:DNA-binding MarR family transcriptional regulator